MSAMTSRMMMAVGDAVEREQEVWLDRLRDGRAAETSGRIENHGEW